MRLTCPTCETTYEVPAGQIPDDGRHVQCSTCHTRWFARPPLEPEPSEDQIIYRLETRATRPARPEASGPVIDPAPAPAVELPPEQPEGDFLWETASPAGTAPFDPLRRPVRDQPRPPTYAPAPAPVRPRPAPQAAPADVAREPAREAPHPAPPLAPVEAARQPAVETPPPLPEAPVEATPEPAVETPVPPPAPVEAARQPSAETPPPLPEAPVEAAPEPSVETPPPPPAPVEAARQPTVELPPPPPPAPVEATPEPAVETSPPPPKAHAEVMREQAAWVPPPAPRKAPDRPVEAVREPPRPAALDLRRAEIAPPPPRPAEVPLARALPAAPEAADAAPGRPAGHHLRLDVTDAQVEAWAAEERLAPRSRFGRGVFVALGLFGAALGLYVFGGELAAMTPALAPAIEAYVGAVDRLREAMVPGNDAAFWPVLERWLNGSDPQG